MIETPPPILWRTVLPALSLIALVLAIVIVLKAVRGYRQNDDRRMLLLAVGLFLILLAPIPVELSATFLLEDTLATTVGVDLASQLLRIAGMVAILGSMYVRR